MTKTYQTVYTLLLIGDFCSLGAQIFSIQNQTHRKMGTESDMSWHSRQNNPKSFDERKK